MVKILNEKCFLVVFALFLITMAVMYFSMRELKKSEKLVEEVEYIDSTHTYNKIYYEKEIGSLRKENKELFDSLKKYKKDIDFLVQFKYKKTYNTGVVTTKPNVVETPKEEAVVPVTPPEARTFEYTSAPNDTFEYKLRVNAEKEPNWYSLSASVKDKFTIVNKSKEGSDINHATIGSEGHGDITDVTIFKKKEKKKLKDRISVGPGVTAGYDPINKNWGMTVGIGVAYDLW